MLSITTTSRHTAIPGCEPIMRPKHGSKVNGKAFPPFDSHQETFTKIRYNLHTYIGKELL